MGGIVSAAVDNDDLVDKLKEAKYIKSIEVERAFRLVDRGSYLLKKSSREAYKDNAWKQYNLHISAPCVYAQVMEGLNLEAGVSFLNIGSGTGYLSTMAGLVIGPTGINHGVELHEDVVEYSRERLANFLFESGAMDASHFCEPQFCQGNGLCLCEEAGLYDRVYCGASCPSSFEQYMKNLIKVGGTLVMPHNDKLLKFVRTSMDTWSCVSLLPVSFSSLIMPTHNATTEPVKLSFRRVRSLQEINRDQIRALLRQSVLRSHADLQKAFIHDVPITISDDEVDDEEPTIVRQTNRTQICIREINQFMEMARSWSAVDAAAAAATAAATAEAIVESVNEGQPEEEDVTAGTAEEFRMDLGSEAVEENIEEWPAEEAVEEIQEERELEEGAEDDDGHDDSLLVSVIQLANSLREGQSRCRRLRRAMSSSSSSWSTSSNETLEMETEEQPDVKKKPREKFDSGIVEDISSESTSPPPDDLEQPRVSVPSSSSSSSGGAARASPRQACSGRRRRWDGEGDRAGRKRRSGPRVRTTRFRSAPPLAKFSAEMRQHVVSLPLPTPLKLFLNYGRPL